MFRISHTVCVHHQLKHLDEKAKSTSTELRATNQDLSRFKNNLTALSGGQTVYCLSDYTSNCILQCQLAHHILQDIPPSRLNKYKTQLNIVKLSEAASQSRLHLSNFLQQHESLAARQLSETKTRFRLQYLFKCNITRGC